MSAKVYGGPWGSIPIDQEIGERSGRWWKRLDDGRLAVWCAWDRVHIAPVPMADCTAPLPARSPNPDRITCALDVRGLYGPEVDEALGVSTPMDTTVDAWEAGTLVPTVDEVRRLAKLTGMPPHFFYGGTMQTIEWTTLDFHLPMPAGRRRPVVRSKRVHPGQQPLNFPSK